MRQFVKKLDIVNDKIDKAFDYVMVLILAGIVILLTIQVIWRYVFNSPITWTEELAKWLFVWSTFIGAAWVAKKNLHIEITMVFKRLPDCVQQILQVFCLAFCIVILAIMIPAALVKMSQQGGVTSNTLHVPMSVLYACAPAGFFLLAAQLLIQLLETIFDWETYRQKFYRKEE